MILLNEAQDPLVKPGTLLNLSPHMCGRFQLHQRRRLLVRGEVDVPEVAVIASQFLRNRLTALPKPKWIKFQLYFRGCKCRTRLIRRFRLAVLAKGMPHLVQLLHSGVHGRLVVLMGVQDLEGGFGGLAERSGHREGPAKAQHFVLFQPGSLKGPAFSGSSGYANDRGQLLQKMFFERR